MTGCGSISAVRRVVSTLLISYDITINCPTAATYPRLRIDSIDLTSSTTWERVVTASNPIRGTYTLGFLGQFTAPINYNDGAAIIQQRLLGLSTMQSCFVSSWGDANDGMSFTLDIELPVVNCFPLL